MKNTIKEYLSKLGTKGGKTTKKRYGKKHFSMIAKKRWKDRKTLENKTEKK